MFKVIDPYARIQQAFLAIAQHHLPPSYWGGEGNDFAVSFNDRPSLVDRPCRPITVRFSTPFNLLHKESRDLESGVKAMCAYLKGVSVDARLSGWAESLDPQGRGKSFFFFETFFPNLSDATLVLEKVANRVNVRHDPNDMPVWGLA